MSDAASAAASQRFTVAVQSFGLDVDSADVTLGVGGAQDGFLIARHFLGIGGSDLVSGQSGALPGLVSGNLASSLSRPALDVDGDGDADAVDGLLLARYLSGLRRDALSSGFSSLDADAVSVRIAGLLR